jgi:ribokinase
VTGVADALFVGDVGLDTTLVVDHVPAADEKIVSDFWAEAPGGVAANASCAARLAGARSRLVCQVGDDRAGRACLAALDDAGVAVTAAVVPGSTGRAIIVLDADGEKRLVLVPGVSLYPTLKQVRDADLDGVRWAHTAPYELQAATALAERCRIAGIPWSLDLEPATLAGGLEALDACLDGASVVFCNQAAARLLGHPAEQRLLGRGVRSVVLSRGSDGATWVDPQDRWDVAAPALDAAVVDTTGAGDCLAGWFVGATIAGSPPPQALAAATAAASASCTRFGAQASYPQFR